MRGFLHSLEPIVGIAKLHHHKGVMGIAVINWFLKPMFVAGQ